jgi:hypothetical protein
VSDPGIAAGALSVPSLPARRALRCFRRGVRLGPGWPAAAAGATLVGMVRRLGQKKLIGMGVILLIVIVALVWVRTMINGLFGAI